MSTPTSSTLFERARKVIPGGVNSPVRAFGSVGGQPVFVERGEGARVHDVDGKEYLDVVASWGPLILGHAHPAVVEAVTAATRRGTTFGAPTVAEIELAERVSEMMPSVDRVRLVSSGTEATMTALRLARGHTGRDKVIKFEGCYHGHADSFLIQAGSGALTLGVPSSPGVPAALASLTLSAPYNDLAAVERVFEEHGEDVAAVIVEPIAGNMGVVPPVDGFLEGLRALTEKHGAVLIFDEVISGFRVAPGGAQERFGVLPDLTTMGKILGGGLPLGAVGGTAALLDTLAPQGSVYQAGTLSGNPLATAAGIATLDVLRDGGAELYAELERRGRRLQEGLEVAIQSTGAPARVQRVGSMMTLFFNDKPVVSLGSLENLRADLYGKLFHGLLERGVWLPPSAYEAFFVSTAHEDADIDAIIERAASTLGDIAGRHGDDDS